MGMAVGSLPALTGLLVDQARLWAEPQATRLIFLPVIRFYLCMLGNFSCYIGESSKFPNS